MEIINSPASKRDYSQRVRGLLMDRTREVFVSNRQMFKNLYQYLYVLFYHIACACVCVCVRTCAPVCVWYNKIEMEQINAPARGPERVTNHLIRGKTEELEL